jgi:uncharacterized membrane protein YagU involved in acid resistance
MEGGTMRWPNLKTMLIAGVVAGTLDMTGALIVYVAILHKATVLVILQRIAAAAFGLPAFKGGYSMALWGLIFHYIIAFSFAAAYVLLYPYQPLMRKSRLVSGLLYGVLVWVIMNRIVLPMTKLPLSRFQWSGALIGAALLILFIGLPVAFITDAGYKRKMDL